MIDYRRRGILLKVGGVGAPLLALLGILYTLRRFEISPFIAFISGILITVVSIYAISVGYEPPQDKWKEKYSFGGLLGCLVLGLPLIIASFLSSVLAHIFQ